MSLILERRSQQDKTSVYGDSSGTPVALASPLVHEDYWAYRVKLSETQAIVGFPKYGIIGVGFAVESNWNTNLPSSTPAERIFEHIRQNKGDGAISDADVIEAIKLVQAAVQEDRQ